MALESCLLHVKHKTSKVFIYNLQIIYIELLHLNETIRSVKNWFIKDNNNNLFQFLVSSRLILNGKIIDKSNKSCYRRL